jgi:hypothetical protein
VLVWRLLPGTNEEPVQDPTPSHLALTAPPSWTPAPSTAVPSRTATPTQTPTPTAPRNMLTPAAIREMLAKAKPVIGGSKVVKMYVYEQHASIEVPTKHDKGVYDTYDYRDGRLEEPRIGGEVKTPLVDLDTFDWDRLPALLKRADKDLGVPNPTSHHIIVDPDYGFTSVKQVLLVYASDEYHRTGYLVATPQGKVIKLVRNE